MSDNKNRIYILFKEEDLKQFEERRNKFGLSRREYILQLMKIEDNRMAGTIRHRNLINEMSELDVAIKALVSSDKGLTDNEKQLLFTQITDIRNGVIEISKQKGGRKNAKAKEE